MSYKYIFSKLLDTKCPRVTICEDDVFFDERFQERFDAAIRFLDSTKHPWDIFAGLIADVHPDVRILRVVMFDGEEYIFLNRMTSMVFNIYNRSSFGELATWDETNCNVQLNTIDRYIESSSNVVTVTTLPFLVGHDEELSSSIWHFDNSQYRMMLDKSRKLLQTKVNEFKRHQIGALTG